jgi:hypothetical protein
VRIQTTRPIEFIDNDETGPSLKKCPVSNAQKGFATFLDSLRPVSGSWYSFQLTGYIVFPASLVAIMTPSSFFAVDR